MINKYNWEMYLQAGGKDIVKVFDNAINNEDYNKFSQTIKKLHQKFCPINSKSLEIKKGLQDMLVKKPLSCKLDCKIIDMDKAMELLVDSVIEFAIMYEDKITVKSIFQYFIESIDLFSTKLSLIAPELCIPYYFFGTFNVLSYICETFEIELPDIPVKSDYNGRFYYYGEICNALQRFRQENKLSVAELWAFLYDYAPNCVGGLAYIQDELPEPRSAYLIGALRENEGLKPDGFFSDNSILLWQCNPEARAGDMIVMYMKAPDKRLETVWRSVTAGFNDPFFWYYRCTYIGKPKRLGNLGFTLERMNQDKEFFKLPIVRKNMQGVNGVELAPSVYNYLLDETNSKGLPSIKFAESYTNYAIETEHDVEIYLLEPLLEKLGWAKSDYVAQFNIRMGRGYKLIPDYVILPTYTPFRETGHFVWESKKSINNEKQLLKDRGQAYTYAMRLNANGYALASQEGIWISLRNDHFKDVVFHCTWGELNEEDKFGKLLKLAGK